MGKLLESIAVTATAPGASPVAATVATGQSLTVRDTSGEPLIVGLMHKRQVTGVFRLTSPLLHDTSNGYLDTIQATATRNVFLVSLQSLSPQDTLSVAVSGSAVAGDIELSCFHVYYPNVAGVDARLTDEVGVRRRGVSVFSKQVSVVATAVGGYTGGTALNATNDYFKANTDYAILGVSAPASTGVLGWRLVGPDWGNVGIVCYNDSYYEDIGASYFARLSRESNIPCVPVFNSANRSQILVSALGDENAAGTYAVTVHMVELRRTRS